MNRPAPLCLTYRYNLLKRMAAAILLLALSAAGGAAATLVGPGEAPVSEAPWTARGAALGNALLGSPEEAVRYNPAWLAAADPLSVIATGGAVQPRRSNFAAVTAQFRRGALGWGAGFATLGSSFDNFTDADSDSEGNIGVSQSLFILGAGTGNEAHTLCFGAAGRVIVDKIGSDIGTVAGLDAGAGWEVVPHLNLSLVLNNAVTAGGQEEDRPDPAVAGGVAWQPPILLLGQTEDPANTLVVALKQHPAAPAGLSAGWESVFLKTVAVRAGIERGNPAAGIGFAAGQLHADAAVQFKETGALYFLTIGWRISHRANPAASIPSVAPAVPVPLDAPGGPSPAPVPVKPLPGPGESRGEPPGKSMEPTAGSVVPVADEKSTDENAAAQWQAEAEAAERARRAAEEEERVRRAEAEEQARQAAEAEQSYLRIAEQAARQAEQGYYNAAAATLGRAETISGISAGRLNEAHALIKSYEYVGTARTREILNTARRYMENRRYQEAASCIERARRCGYGREETDALSSKLDELIAAGDMPDAAAVEKELAAAEKLCAEGRYTEARRSLLKVLSADPGNRRARELLDRIYGIGR